MTPLHDPIIIIGCHRSGTSMLSQLLHMCGVEMGASNGHWENPEFIRANEEIFTRGHSYWDRPEGVDYMIQHFGIPGRMTAPVAYAGGPWGFKDPRAAFTMPVWLKLWPKARLINITRHGLDVAISLATRERQRSPANPTFSHRCWTYAGALTVWWLYVQAAIRYRGRNYLEIKYESICQEPEKRIGELCDFAHVKVSGDKIKEVSRIVNGDRAYAHQHDEVAEDFVAANRNHPLLIELGYEDGPKT